MDPTPVTAGQFFSTLGAAILGTFWLVSRWWDWRAAHPEDLDDGLSRRFRLKQELWLEEQPAYIQAHLLRGWLADAQREACVREIMAAEARGGCGGR
jgi:hypothetical protein